MNAKRRAELSAIWSKLEDAVIIVASMKEEIQNHSEVEQEAFDNMPEGLQQSERGQRMEECADNLNDAFNSLEEAGWRELFSCLRAWLTKGATVTFTISRI